MSVTMLGGKRPSWVTRRQVTLFLVPPVIVVLVGCWLWLTKPEQLRLLWAEPSGVRLSIVALAWAAVISALCLVCAVAVNQSAMGAGWSWGREAILVGLLLGWTALGWLPVLFVVLIGPASIQIQRNLLSPP